MLRQLSKYGASLIALYIVVANGSQFGQVLNNGAQGISTVSRTLQGR